jgi:transketolase
MSDTPRTEAVIASQPMERGFQHPIATAAEIGLAKLCAELERENAALSAQVAELRKDAERYQYQFSTGEWDYSDEWIGRSKTQVDAAIDAAKESGSRP